MEGLVSKALGQKFGFSIKNTTGAAVVVALLAACFDTLAVTAATTAAGDPLVYTSAITKKYTSAAEIVAAGYNCDYVIDDGVITGNTTTGLVARSTNSKKTIRHFREFVKQGVFTVKEMYVQVNNTAAYNETMEVIKVNPLLSDNIEYLPLSDFYSVNQSVNDKINVKDLGLTLSAETMLLLRIPDGVEYNFSMRF